MERIQEMLELIRQLKNPIMLYGQSIANPVNFAANLPEQKEDLIKELEDKIAKFTDWDANRISKLNSKIYN